eukprot:jgi/Chrzof1/12864/Cz07g10050.t1
MAAPNSSVIQTVAGVQMPRMMYGTAWKKERTAQLVERAVLAGFRGIDTACQPKHYREDLVGAALVNLANKHGIHRKDIFLQTKYTSVGGQDPANIPYDPKAPLQEQVRQSFARSLDNLRTDYVDSLLMHSPMPSHDKTMTVWRVMEEFANSVKARQLGISNIYEPEDLQHLYEEASLKPAVVQNRFYGKTGFDRDIRAFCKQHGVIYQSFWTLTAESNRPVINSPTVSNIAKRLGATPAQVFYRFVMQLGIVPLNGTTSEDHMRADLDVLNWPDLSDQDMASIGKLIGEH